MARFRPAGSRKPKAEAPKRGFIPCLIILVAGFAIISLLLYAVLKSG